MIYTNNDNIGNYLITKISTLKIYSNKSTISKTEYNYLNALNYLFQSFERMNKNNNFCMYLSENTFLIANHTESSQINPFVFINEKGEILFNVNIRVFDSAIEEFKGYIRYYDEKRPNLPEEKKVQLAIKDYKNDKLDFYANSRVVMQSLIDKARNEFEKEYN